jgi:hypothetical protein
MTTPLPAFNESLSLAAQVMLARGGPKYIASHSSGWARHKKLRDDTTFVAPCFVDTASIQPGRLLLQKDAPWENSEGAKQFQVTSLDNLVHILHKPRNVRMAQDEASLYWSIEDGMRHKFFADVEDVHKKGLTLGDIRLRVSSLCEKLHALMPNSCFSVHVSEGDKPSCHIHAVRGKHAQWVRWKTFVEAQVLPLLTEDEADVLDTSVYRIGAFRIPGCTKFGKARFLREEPDPELSDPEAVFLHAQEPLEFILRVCPFVLFPADEPLSASVGLKIEAEKPSRKRTRTENNNQNNQNNHHNNKRLKEETVQHTEWSEAALAWIKAKDYEVSSVKPGEGNTLYVGLVKSQASRTCPFANRVHRSNTLGFILDTEAQQIVCFCHGKCADEAGKKSLRYERSEAGVWGISTRGPLRWILDKTGVTLTPETIYEPFGEYQYYANGFLCRGARILSNYFIDSIEGTNGNNSNSNNNTYCEPRMRPLSFPAHNSTVCIRAGYGMGKTHGMLRQMFGSSPQQQQQQQQQQKQQYIIVTHRKTLAYQLHQTLQSLGQTDCALYTEIGNHALDTKLVVQLDSIHKAAHITPDLLILDECESLLNHIDADTLSKRGAWVYSEFEDLVKSAKKVVALDADLGPRTIEWLSALRTDVACFHNTYKKYTDHKVVLIDDNALWVNKLLKMLAAGKNVAVPCTCKSTANGLFVQMQERGFNAVVYTGDTQDSVKAETFADVNAAWSSFQCVLYTSVCEAGVSFDLKHFDAIFAFAGLGGPGPRPFVQMLHRVRLVGSKKIYLHVQDPARHQLHAPDTCLNTLAEMIKMPSFLAENGIASLQTPLNIVAPKKRDWADAQKPYALLHTHNVAEKQEAKSNFMHQVVAILKNQGYVFSFSKRQQVSSANLEQLHQTQGDLKAERVLKLVRARDIDAAEFERLKARKQHTEEDKLVIERFMIRAAFRYHGAIDAEWIETYDMHRTQKHYKRLCEIFPRGATPENERVERLREDAEVAAGWNLNNAFEAVKDKKRNNAWVHYLAHEVLRLLGFSGVFGQTAGVERSVVEAGVENFKEWFSQIINGVSVRKFTDHLLGIRCKTTEWNFELLLRYANCVLHAAYGVSIKYAARGRARTNADFVIDGLEIWNANTAITDNRPCLF